MLLLLLPIITFSKYLFAFGKDVIAVLAFGKIGLGDHSVDFVLVHVFVTDLDKGWINPLSWGLGWIERKTDATDLKNRSTNLVT